MYLKRLGFGQCGPAKGAPDVWLGSPLCFFPTLSPSRESNNTRQDSSASIPINSHRLPATADDPRQVFLLFNDFLYCELNIDHQALIRTYDFFRLWLAYVPSITKIGVPMSKGRANYPGTMCFLVKIEMNQGPPGRGDQICGAGLGPGSDSAKHPVPVGTSVQGIGQNQRASVELTEFRAPPRQARQPSTLNVRSIPHSACRSRARSRDTLAFSLVAPHTSSPQ